MLQHKSERTAKIFVLLLTNIAHFLITELGDYDYRGITAYNWPHPRGITVRLVPITAGLPRIPRDYRGYRGNPVVRITVQLSTPNSKRKGRRKTEIRVNVAHDWQE